VATRACLLLALPVAFGMIVLKWLYDGSSAKHLDFSPLLTGIIAAEVFIVGFMLSGTAGDFKEAERLPVSWQRASRRSRTSA
jgi:TctA family transporter